MKYLLWILLSATALALNFGSFIAPATPAILPSGKASLTVNGPYHIRWQLLNDTGASGLRRTGQTITVGKGSYDIDFTGAGSPPNRYVTLRAGTKTVITIK